MGGTNCSVTYVSSDGGSLQCDPSTAISSITQSTSVTVAVSITGAGSASAPLLVEVLPVISSAYCNSDGTPCPASGAVLTLTGTAFTSLNSGSTTKVLVSDPYVAAQRVPCTVDTSTLTATHLECTPGAVSSVPPRTSVTVTVTDVSTYTAASVVATVTFAEVSGTLCVAKTTQGSTASFITLDTGVLYQVPCSGGSVQPQLLFAGTLGPSTARYTATVDGVTCNNVQYAGSFGATTGVTAFTCTAPTFSNGGVKTPVLLMDNTPGSVIMNGLTVTYPATTPAPPTLDPLTGDYNPCSVSGGLWQRLVTLCAGLRIQAVTHLPLPPQDNQGQSVSTKCDCASGDPTCVRFALS